MGLPPTDNRTAPAEWIGGLAEWIEGDTAFLSVAFTWKLPEAWQRAKWLAALGYKVRAGGPGTFTRPKFLADVAQVGGQYPDAIRFQNPIATMASRGCPVGCWHCIVPKMEGRAFTLLPDFPVRPILCDNNLSALPPEFQDHIVARYLAEGVQLIDANSGFEPRTFDEDVFRRWRPVLKGPWRFAYDDMADRPYVERVMKMLRDLPPKRKRVYVLIGNEPVEPCLDRIYEVLAWRGEPHVQPYMKLNALERSPHVRFDWTEKKLRDVARWANRRAWRKAPRFEDYRPSAHTARDAARYDAQQGMFL